MPKRSQWPKCENNKPLADRPHSAPANRICRSRWLRLEGEQAKRTPYGRGLRMLHLYGNSAYTAFQISRFKARPGCRI